MEIIKFTQRGMGAYTFAMLLTGLLIGNIEINNNIFFNIFLLISSIASFFLGIYAYQKDKELFMEQ